MRFLSRVVAIWAVGNGLAFSAQLPTSNRVANDTTPIEIDYETARFEKVVTAVRIDETITLDGVLDEPAWQSATPASDFTQWARPGVPATNTNEVWFLYDEDNLYVGWKAGDQDSENVVVNELREDFFFRDSDGVSVHHRQPSRREFPDSCSAPIPPAHGGIRKSRTTGTCSTATGMECGTSRSPLTKRAGSRNTGSLLRRSDSRTHPNRCGG